MSEYLRSYIIPPTTPPATPSLSFISQNPDENIQILNNRAAEMYDFLIDKTLEMYRQVGIFLMVIRKFKNYCIENWRSFQLRFTENKTVLVGFLKGACENTINRWLKIYIRLKKLRSGG